MANEIENLLKKLGPSSSSDIAQMLVESGLSPDAARARISRARPPVQRLRGISLPNREHFLFLEGEFGSRSFNEALVEVLKQKATAYGRAICGLEARQGAVYAMTFPIATGAPVKPAKKLIPHDRIEEILVKLRLVSRGLENGIEILFLTGDQGMSSRRRAAVIAEDIVLAFAKKWLINSNWTSTNGLKIRDKQCAAEFGQFAWDFVAPTYLHSITSQTSTRKKDAFLVGDILLDRRITTSDILPYQAKWNALLAQGRPTPFQPILICDSIEPDALFALRKGGALTLLTSTLFGEDMAEDIRSLISTIENAAASISSDPSTVFALFDRLSKIEGASLNLRGVLFEMMVAHFYKYKGYGIDIRVKLRGSNGTATDIDVRAANAEEIVICECKGKAPGNLVTEAEIGSWIEKRLPILKNHINSWDRSVRRFEFYSASGYSPEALSLIKKITLTHKRQPIGFIDGALFKKTLTTHKQTALVEIFGEHFT